MLFFRSDETSIIAVHGLGGHPINTWTSKQTELSWLRDLLPKHLPRARILSYGYDADVVAVLGKTSSDRILQHAQTMCAQLAADREVRHTGVLVRDIGLLLLTLLPFSYLPPRKDPSSSCVIP